MSPPPGVVGTSVPRKDAFDKVTGRALYLDDLTRPDMLHGATVRSTIPAGRIRRIVRDPAFDWSDVVVVDHHDIPGENVVALIVDDQPCLVADRVRHREEPILLLAHADRERLLAATRAITIEYEAEPALLTVEDALRATRLVQDNLPGNILKSLAIARGDVEAALAASPIVVEGTYAVGHQEHVYIEPNGALAWFEDDGSLCVTGSLQCPYYVHKALVRLFALPAERVRVIQSATGGGFGGKEEYPSMIAAHAALLAKKAGRPVKIVYDRLEDIAATTKRHPAVVRHRTGVASDGRLLAQDIDVVMDGGAYVTLSPVVLSRGALHAAGAYSCDAVRVQARAVATNTPPNGAFRGFGAPQTLFAVEAHMEKIAAQLGIDAIDLRRKNLYVSKDTMPTGQVLEDGVSAKRVLEAVLARSRYSERKETFALNNATVRDEMTQRERRAPRRVRASAGAEVYVDGAGTHRRVLRGIGASLVLHGSGFTGSGESMLASIASVEIADDGHPRVLAASTEIGQGTETIFAQMAADALGVSYDLVEIATPDTANVPNSGPTVASRTCMIVGGLVTRAARDVAERLRSFAPDGWPDDDVFLRVARAYRTKVGPLRVDTQYAPPPDVTWDDATYTGSAYAAYGWMATIVEVEVDADTFEARPLRATAAADVGRVIHPRLAEGQVEGGVLQALGWSLLEDVRWKDGGVWNHQLTNYIIPTAADAPPIDVVFVEAPFAHGAYGSKGVGELPMDGAAPAVVAAIADATGVLVPHIPLLPETLHTAIAKGLRE